MRIELNLHQNLLTFHLTSGSEPIVDWIELPGVIDIGERGRLLSLELYPENGNAIIVPLEDRADPLARSAEISVRCGKTPDGVITVAEIPRRGPDYEITYPSGNQCWIGANGAVSCSVA